jgi:hypothetical protein
MEGWVGRSRSDSQEIRRKSASSHVARMTGGRYLLFVQNRFIWPHIYPVFFSLCAHEDTFITDISDISLFSLRLFPQVMIRCIIQWNPLSVILCMYSYFPKLLLQYIYLRNDISWLIYIVVVSHLTSGMISVN